MQSYKVIHHIGSGSFGSVYLTEKNGERFALKKIHIDPFTIEKSLREIEPMKFVHPNLVRVYHYHLDETIDELQIIMEYCEEGDLMQYFNRVKKLSSQEILDIFRQIFRAFILMNVKGIIHRDLKPENILIGKGNVIKVGDFGCARCIEELDMSKVENLSFDIGTYLYASPQQLSNVGYSFKSDVWAAGCIAYLLQFGQHPFLHSTPHKTLQKIKERTQGKLIELQPAIDPTISKLITLSLIYDDQQRASWRQIWLSRIFAPKIVDIKKYLDYLKYLSSIASWITKQFWKVRKEYNISKYSDQIFAYFIIKFQYTNLKMALKIIKKSPEYRYLFDEESFKNYFPNEQQFTEIKQSYLGHEKYFKSIKSIMEAKKEASVEIALREPLRSSAFSDLEKSIRAAYKVLIEVVALSNTKGVENKVWAVIGYWINFESWFSYEKDPRLQKMLSECQDVGGVIAKELGKYEMGVVE